MSAATAPDNPTTGWSSHFAREELDALLAMNDLRSWGTLALNWALVFACLALVAAWPNPLSILVALFVIGARQLGFAVIMHEASHRSFLSNRALNDWVGNWLAAYPIWSDWRPYRSYHLGHHARTGSDQDPDIGLVRPFPITASSLRRKVWRDLSGRTGLKFARGAWSRTFARYGADPGARRAAQGVLITNLALLGILAGFGRPELYLLWLVAWLTTNTLVTRIRAIAEHALTPDRTHTLGNTRTTLASWWERLFLAPNRVNYHLEHHLLMTVPHYNLPRMHEMLKQRGLLDDACITRGYAAVLRNAASAPESGRPAPDDDGEALSHVNGL